MRVELLEPSSLNNPLLKPLLPQVIPKNGLPLVLSDASRPIALLFVTIDNALGKLDCQVAKFLTPATTTESATYLLKGLEDQCRHHKLHTVNLFFNEKTPEAAPLHQALAGEHWSLPEHWRMSCYFDKSFDPPWLHANLRFPKNFSFCTWDSLSSEQIAALKIQERQAEFPHTLSPFRHEDKDSQFTLCLLDHEEVVGWVITRRVDSSYLSYDAIYVNPKYKMIGLTVPMMAESIKQVMRSPIPGAIIDTYMTLYEPYWIEFMKKRLQPHAISVINTFRSFKQVAAG